MEGGRTAISALKVRRGSRPGSAKDWFNAYAHRKNEEAWKLEELKNTALMMKKRQFQASHYNSMLSKERDHAEQCTAVREKELKLQDRRNKLVQLLKADEAKYEKERQQRSEDLRLQRLPYPYPEVLYLKNHLDGLRKKNAEERKKLAEKLSYESWKKSHPTLREEESKRLNHFIREAWVDQKKFKEEEKRREEEQRRQEKIIEDELRRQEELVWLDKLRHEKENLEEWKEHLSAQVELLKKKSEQEKMIIGRENELMQRKSCLEGLMLKREKILQQRKRKELELCWRRQHSLKLKQKSLMVKQDLDEDEATLEDLLKSFVQEPHDKLTDVKDVEWLRRCLEEQKKLEASREQEYDLMFSEEARQEWNKREAQWNKEAEARDKLMQDVILGLRQQLSDKLDDASDQIACLNDERTRLMNQISDEKKELYGKEQVIAAMERKKLSGVQDEGLSVADQAEKLALEEEINRKQLEQHRKEIARLEEEIRALWTPAYAPPRYGRKKISW